jgi:CBS-domain-containing membrane protein
MYKKNIVRHTDKIFKIIKILNIQPMKTIFVLSKKKELIGTITDRDLRLALIRKINLANHVSQICNKKYKFIYQNENINKAEYLAKKNNLEAIPIISKAKKLISVFSTNKTFQKLENLIIIMAGGKGKRLYPLTKNTPKPLLKYKGEPLLFRIFEELIKQDFKTVYVTLFYLSNKIKAAIKKKIIFNNLIVKFIVEKTPLGTAGSIFCINPFPKRTFIVLNY